MPIIGWWHNRDGSQSNTESDKLYRDAHSTNSWQSLLISLSAGVFTLGVLALLIWLVNR